MKNILIFLTLPLLGGLLSGCSNRVPDDIRAIADKLPEKVDFNLHIKPLLSDRCFKCHGPDKNQVKAGLRLDTPERAYAVLTAKDSHRKADYALVAGSLDKSEVFHRIISDDPEYMMPAPNANLKLTLEEKALLIRWIEQGAEYKKHWSLIAPTKSVVPKVTQAPWVKNPIDYFTLAKMEEKGLKPNAEANKEQLLRRVSFDLTGLPPSPKEVDDFLADKSSNAYEKVVNRLLASPQYGERMAADWLDVARYADSHGYQDDGMRNVWPYRDWVIRAFNQNLRYSHFISWQLAGDLLTNPNGKSPSKDMLVATCFNRNHPQTQEGGVVDEEYRVEYVSDRTNTFGKAFLGLTVECARCHDHKYDPISQKDYYSLSAFFNSNNDSGIIPYNGEASPTVILASPEAEAKIKFIRQQMAPIEKALNKERYRPQFEQWLATAAKTPEKYSGVNMGIIGHFTFDAYEMQKDRPFKPRPIPNYTPPKPKEVAKKPAPKKKQDSKKKEIVKKKDEPPLAHKLREFKNLIATSELTAKVGGDLDRKPELVDGKFGKCLKFIGDAGVDFSREMDFDREEPFSVSIWFKTLDKGEEGTIFAKANGEFEGERGYRCRIQNDGTLMVTMSYVWPDNCIDIRTLDKLKLNEWYHITLTYDGSSKANGIHLYINGKQPNYKVLTDNLSKSIRYGENKSHWDKWTDMAFMLGKDFRGTIKDVMIDELKTYHRQLSSIEVQELYGSTVTVGTLLKKTQRTPEQTAQLFEYYLLNQFDKTYNENFKQLTQLRDAENQVLTDQPEVMRMHEAKEPRPTFVLARGAYDAPKEPVTASTPAQILAFGKQFPKNRQGLAQWLLDEHNPLTTRVVANRLWMLVFGKGLVNTQEDFGNQGSLPSHPELLDWLAVNLRENGWNTKAFMKQLVMSATYRQSSIPSAVNKEKDPDNLLYTHYPAYRLSAEMIRDNALFASGLLSKKIGGESVYPYQPAGIWEALATRNLTSYKQGTGEDLYRRSLYTVWKRSSPPPSMLNFDAPDRYACIVRRQKTATPLQSLVLMNDPQYIEAARMLGERMMKEGGTSPEQRITLAYKALTSRSPRRQELALIKQLYDEELADFNRSPQKINDLLNVGEHPTDSKLNRVELAICTVVASTLMNYDEFVMKR